MDIFILIMLFVLASLSLYFLLKEEKFGVGACNILSLCLLVWLIIIYDRVGSILKVILVVATILAFAGIGYLYYKYKGKGSEING